jgi:rod shape-determining protein MreC
MAPPRNRRPGFSRRIQFGLFIGYVIAIVGTVSALFLVVMSRLDPQSFSQLRMAALDVIAPLSAAGRGAVRSVQTVEESITGYFRAGSQNRALREEMRGARRELIAAQSIRRQNVIMRRTLKLIDHYSQPVVTGRLVGSSLSSARRFATLAAGARQGIQIGQPVIAADGLVGRILETGQSASRVLLLSDAASAVPVRLVRSGIPALARGRGDGTVRISALFPGARPFRRGDVVTTSGTGGIYPPDVPVAVITRVEGDSAIGWPLASPETLDFAVVMKPYQPPFVPIGQATP